MNILNFSEYGETQLSHRPNQFGMPGETKETINNTINKVRTLIEDGKLYLVSPNLCTYHPSTALTRLHKKIDTLNYITIPEIQEPYDFFEEAVPNHLCKLLTIDTIEHIKTNVEKKWNVLNENTTDMSQVNSSNIVDSEEDKYGICTGLL